MPRKRPDPAAALRAPGHPGFGRDPATIQRFRPVVEAFARLYRPDVRGFDHLPAKGPFLVVGNHSGGAAPPDMPILLTEWWKRRGVEEPVYGLFHSFFIGLPGVRGPLTKFGALEAGWDAAQSVLEAGGIVMVYPGGDHEAFRPWAQRNRIDFAGRTGFVRLAIRTGVPVVPVVTIGVQDSVLVVSRGERLARFMPHLNRWRLRVMPVMIGLPWGISVGIPPIPIPSRATVQIGEPIDLAAEVGTDPDDAEAIQVGYSLVTGRMQDTLDQLAAERRGGG